MKTALFCFDGPMYKDVNGIYCNTTITNEMLERYLYVGNRLVLIIRTYTLDKTYADANLHPLELLNIEIVELPNFNSIKGFLFERKKFCSLIDHEVAKADYIFARMPSTISDQVVKRTRKQNKSYMVEVGGCAWDAFTNHSLLGKLVAPLMYFRQKVNILNSEFATYVTKGWLQKRYPSKGQRLSSSNVYLEDHDEMILINRLEKIDKKSLKNLVLGTAAGVDVKYKGQDDVIKAIAILNKNHGYNIQYQLIGVGDSSRLNKIADDLGVGDYVSYQGLKTKSESFVWMKSLDLYIQPSKQEGLPRSLIEAMSFGLPAIGSTAGGIPELLEKQFVFKKGSVEGIVNIILMATKDDLVSASKKNFKRSKCFNKNVLESERKKFFRAYANHVDARN